jgi:hypothetical protein
VGVPAAADSLKSGLQVGEAPDAFNVRDITGPHKGKALCYRCRYGARPVVNIFARELTDELTTLVKQLNEKVARNEARKMAGFVVFLTSDPDALEPKLEELAEKEQIERIPLTVFEGDSGPESYNIAQAADVTVMMWVNSKVAVNHALPKGKLDMKMIEKILKDTDKILADD